MVMERDGLIQQIGMAGQSVLTRKISVLFSTILFEDVLDNKNC